MTVKEVSTFVVFSNNGIAIPETLHSAYQYHRKITVPYKHITLIFEPDIYNIIFSHVESGPCLLMNNQSHTRDIFRT